MPETRAELLERLYETMADWKKDPRNFTWRPVGDVMRHLEQLEEEHERKAE